MTDAIESQSLAIMADMKRLQTEIKQALAQTDALLASFGTSREELEPLIARYRDNLSEQQRAAFDKKNYDLYKSISQLTLPEKKHNHAAKPKRRQRLGIVARL